MKSSKEIIEIIQNDPLYQEVTQLQALIEILPSKFRDLIAFAYRKEDDLLIACKHNAGLLELRQDNNIKLIKNALNLFCSYDKSSNLNLIKDIKIFVSKKYLAKLIRQREEAINLAQIKEMKCALKRELANKKCDGNFKINIKDDALNAIFVQIREKLIAFR